MVKVGEKAPEFSNVAAYQKRSDFPKKFLLRLQGQMAGSVFTLATLLYLSTEIKEFSRLEKEFKNLNCEILACSTDSEWSHKNWFERDLKEVRYPVLADTTQDISRSYNALGKDGAAQRGTFIIDPEGILRWMMVSDNSVGRSVKETLRAVKALQTGELCPVEWEPGDEFLKKP